MMWKWASSRCHRHGKKKRKTHRSLLALWRSHQIRWKARSICCWFNRYRPIRTFFRSFDFFFSAVVRRRRKPFAHLLYLINDANDDSFICENKQLNPNGLPWIANTQWTAKRDDAENCSIQIHCEWRPFRIFIYLRVAEFVLIYAVCAPFISFDWEIPLSSVWPCVGCVCAQVHCFNIEMFQRFAMPFNALPNHQRLWPRT